MKKIRTPQFVSDLYADLRDRRLLIPVAALLVALVAVPVALSSSGSGDVSATPAAAVPAEDATAVEPAVLAEQSGVRNYRKRLAALKANNPFEQKFALPTPGSVELEPEGAAPSAAASSAVASTGTASDSSGLAAAAESVADSVTQPSSGATTSAPAPEPEPAEEPKPQVRFFAGRVDVKLGTAGETKDYKDVRRLDFLPNEKDPLVVFIGLTEDGSRAVFSLSSAITETEGDGSCAPKQPSPCQFLRLKTGEERRLTVGGDDTTEPVSYRLKLLETHIVRVPDPRDD